MWDNMDWHTIVRQKSWVLSTHWSCPKHHIMREHWEHGRKASCILDFCNGQWMISGDFHALPILYQGEKWPVAIKHKVGWTQKPVWMWNWTEKSNTNIKTHTLFSSYSVHFIGPSFMFLYSPVLLERKLVLFLEIISASPTEFVYTH